MTHSPHRPRSKAISWAAKFEHMQQEQIGAPEAGFYTTIQWAEKIHRSIPQTQRLLRYAVAAGEMEVRTYKIVVGMFKRPVPHYRIVKPVRSGRSSSGKAS